MRDWTIFFYFLNWHLISFRFQGRRDKFVNRISIPLSFPHSRRDIKVNLKEKIIDFSLSSLSLMSLWLHNSYTHRHKRANLSNWLLKSKILSFCAILTRGFLRLIEKPLKLSSRPFYTYNIKFHNSLKN